MTTLRIHFPADFPPASRDQIADLLSAELAEYALGEVVASQPDIVPPVLALEVNDKPNALTLVRRILNALDVPPSTTVEVDTKGARNYNHP